MLAKQVSTLCNSDVTQEKIFWLHTENLWCFIKVNHEKSIASHFKLVLETKVGKETVSHQRINFFEILFP